MLETFYFIQKKVLDMEGKFPILKENLYSIEACSILVFCH